MILVSEQLYGSSGYRFFNPDRMVFVATKNMYVSFDIGPFFSSTVKRIKDIWNSCAISNWW